SKAKALRHRMTYNGSRSSTDRLKRVQQLPCFNAVSSIPETGLVISNNNFLGAPSLRIGNPIAILVRCEEMVVMAVAQVNRLKFASRDNLLELPIHLLTDPTAKVDSQILGLQRATLEDDMTQAHDWCWSSKMGPSCNDVMGHHVHPINPTVSVQRPGKPAFLFESMFLVTLACNLFQELMTQDRKDLPKVKRCEDFPYQSSGTLHAKESEEASVDGHTDCSRCGSAVTIDWENTQRVLEHMGAHILFDPELNRTQERCGLCLWPAVMCPIYVTKGRGTHGRYTVDITKSTCPNLVRFNYKNASESSENSPCSNVPIICSLCPAGSPAVWTYNLEAHFRGRHQLTSPAHFPTMVERSLSEKKGMKSVWQAR
ncbi:hypothetical protein BC826DRAFT_874317, partial [Russula brevipes]